MDEEERGQLTECTETGAVFPSPAAIEEARKLNPIDDLFFSKMAESREVCKEIIVAALWEDVIVNDVVPQNTIVNLQGRGLRLDLLSDAAPALLVEAELPEDSSIGPKGAKVNIEVQKSDDDDHQKRVRYHASAITMNYTPRGTKKFRDIPNVVEIFISAFDPFRKGKNRYKINRVIDGDGTVVHNGVTEVYINTEIQDYTTKELGDLSDLMRLFVEPNAYDYEKFPHFSKRKHQFKETEEGVIEMSESMQILMDKERDKGEIIARTDAIRKMIRNLHCTAEKAMEILEIPIPERVQYLSLM